MDQSLTTWLIPIVCLLVGIGVGYLLARNSGPSQTQRQVEGLQDRFDTYQHEVITHINTTASLLNKLSQNYQDIQNHLAEGAQNLALDEQTRQQLLITLHNEKASRPSASVRTAEHLSEPPRDYALKGNDEVHGTLNEEFGFKKK